MMIHIHLCEESRDFNWTCDTCCAVTCTDESHPRSLATKLQTQRHEAGFSFLFFCPIEHHVVPSSTGHGSCMILAGQVGPVGHVHSEVFGRKRHRRIIPRITPQIPPTPGNRSGCTPCLGRPVASRLRGRDQG